MMKTVTPAELAALIKAAEDAVAAALDAAYRVEGETVADHTMQALNIAASKMQVARVFGPNAR